MEQKPIPKEISYVNQYDIKITWNDGHESIYPARELRLDCPCAKCIHEMTGEKILNPETVPQTIQPTNMSLVGRYAISITWSDGHQTGIYAYDYLRKICPCEKCKGNNK